MVPETQAQENLSQRQRPVEEPVSITSSRICPQHQLPLLKNQYGPSAPEFVAAPTAVEEPVAAPQAPEFVAAPTRQHLLEDQLQLQFKNQAPQAAPSNAPAFQQTPPTYSSSLSASSYQVNQDNYPGQPSQFGVAVGGY